jgi:1-acyl-sn-glycerol-3-phosphate acyltransferase
MGMGPGVFRKRNGKISVTAWFVLWPCLAGQWASLLYYRCLCGSCDEVALGVLIGGRLSRREAAEAVERGVTAVLDLTAEFSEVRPFRRVTYRNIQIVDLTAPTTQQLKDAAAFITEQSTRGVVYVHCKIGYSRSAAAVGAYLLAVGRARTADDAIATIRLARPSIVVRPEAVAALRRFQATLTPRGVRHDDPKSTASAIVSMLLAAVARLICGTPPRWAGCQPSTRQRIYFANHTSHLDFLVLWASLPAEVRARTRPVAGRDYWNRNRVCRYLAGRVFRAVLVDRRDTSPDANRDAVISAARRTVEQIVNAIGTGHSLIIFPEGTRTTGPDVGPFKSGIYYLCRRRPDVELVPVYLDNLNRILPKGEAIPVPVVGSVTFGQSMRLEAGEGKEAFLARARSALVMVQRPCTCSSTAISSAS